MMANDRPTLKTRASVGDGGGRERGRGGGVAGQVRPPPRRPPQAPEDQQRARGQAPEDRRQIRVGQESGMGGCSHSDGHCRF